MFTTAGLSRGFAAVIIPVWDSGASETVKSLQPIYYKHLTKGAESAAKQDRKRFQSSEGKMKKKKKLETNTWWG